MRKHISESYNGLVHKAISNKAQDELDSVPMVDPRIKSQFELGKQGQRAPYSELMTSYKAGSKQFKHMPMPKQKRFGVIDMEQVAMRKNQNKTVQEMTTHP